MKVNLATLLKMSPVCLWFLCVSPRDRLPPHRGAALLPRTGVGLGERDDETPSHCLTKEKVGRDATATPRLSFTRLK